MYLLARSYAGPVENRTALGTCDRERGYRPGLAGRRGVLPGGGWVADPVPGPQTSTPSELFPRVPSGAIGPTSVKPRPAGRAGGLAGSITRSFPRMNAIISFWTTWAPMFRVKV